MTSLKKRRRKKTKPATSHPPPSTSSSPPTPAPSHKPSTNPTNPKNQPTKTKHTSSRRKRPRVSTKTHVDDKTDDVVFVKGSEGKGRDVEKEMMEDVETVVKNALYFTRKLVQARGKDVGGWGLEDLGNIHGWALWLCKHVDEVGKDENVKKTLSRKLGEHGIRFEALLYSEIALFDTLISNPHLQPVHILHLLRMTSTSPSKSSSALLSERIALAAQRRAVAQQLSKLVPRERDIRDVDAQKVVRRVACARLMRKKLLSLKENERTRRIVLMGRERDDVEMLCRVFVERNLEEVEKSVDKEIVRVLDGFSVKTARDLLWVLDGKLIAKVCVGSFGVFQEYSTFLLLRLKEAIGRWREREEQRLDGGDDGSEVEEEGGDKVIVLDSESDSFDEEVDGNDMHNEVSEGKRLAQYYESNDLLKDPEIVMDDIEARLKSLFDQGGAMNVILSEALEPVLSSKPFEIPAIAKRLDAMRPTNRWKKRRLIE